MDPVTAATDDATNIAEQPKPRRSWRDELKVHPAAEIFPPVSETELRELAADIDKNGLREPVDLYHDRETKDFYVLDGRTRLDALELLGRKICDNNGFNHEYFSRNHLEVDGPQPEPWAYVVSKNIYRRHLHSKQKQELIVRLLKAGAEWSDRRVAKMANVDHQTVAGVRAKLERRGEIRHVEKRIDTKGRNQPASKAKVRAPKAGATPPMSERRPSISPPTLPTANTGNREIDNEAAANALVEFKFACKAWLPKMDAGRRAEAIRYCAGFAGEKMLAEAV
jgi:ParB-like nuclease domain